MNIDVVYIIRGEVFATRELAEASINLSTSGIACENCRRAERETLASEIQRKEVKTQVDHI